MDKTRILQELREYVQSKKGGEVDEKTERLLLLLGTVTEEDVYIGDKPTYYFATITCNSTGVGRSTFKGTESQRTVAKDYVTDEYLFVDGHAKTAEKGASLFFLKPGQTINYYKKEDTVKVAKEFGFQLHLRDFRDLNYTLYDHRLNRHTVNVTKGPFTYPIRPIYAVIGESTEKFAIGCIYEMEGIEYIVIEPDDLEAMEKAKNKSGCAPWMFFGFVFPPIFIAAAFVMFVKMKKERMRG